MDKPGGTAHSSSHLNCQKPPEEEARFLSPGPTLNTVAMVPRARRLYGKFLQAYRKLVLEVEKTPLAILIWGPGPTFAELHDKRIQILNELRAKGHAAVFSEEIEKDIKPPEISLRAREMLQALSADFIILLMASPGSIGEAHDFAPFEKIGCKMLVFVDEKTKDGYSNQGLLRDLSDRCGNVETYTAPRDLSSCLLMAKVMEKVRVLQFAKWQRSLQRLI